jgi:hypothetical protein
MAARDVAPIGVQGNAWPGGNAITGGVVSAIVDTFSCPFVTGFGHADGATTITLLGSMDGVNFYAVATQVLAGAADFAINVTCAARYFVLKSSASLTGGTIGTIAACGSG